MYRCDSHIFFFYISIGIYCDTEGYVILFCNSNTFQLSNAKSCIISDELPSDISTRSCKRLMKKMQLHDKRKLVKIFGQTIAAQFHSTLEEIIQQWHWAILILCFPHFKAETTFEKTIFMIHFRQLSALCYSCFIENCIQKKHSCFINVCYKVRKRSSMQIIGISCHICSINLTQHYLLSFLQLLVWLKCYHEALNQTKNFHETPLSWRARFSQNNTTLSKSVDQSNIAKLRVLDPFTLIYDRVHVLAPNKFIDCVTTVLSRDK